MEQLKSWARRLISTLPPGQRVVAVAAVAVLAIATLAFVRWVTTPSYTLLYGNLDDTSLSQVISELESQGVPYRIEAGGSRVLVPRSQVYQVRASLAEAGIVNEITPPGYELLDAQGLTVSDFKQRVDFQRALEGELAKTLMAMEGIDGATVRLAIPEESPFQDEQKPVTASVLLDAREPLSSSEVDAVVLLVSSAVEGLDPSNVTVADTSGRVLAAPGDVAVGGLSGDRNMRQTREFEAALASDVQRLLAGITEGRPPSVVVRAQLNFDQTSTESETYDPGSRVILSERTSTEQLAGDGATAAGAGVPGVSGGLVAPEGGRVEYEKRDVAREYGVTREVVRTVQVPGEVERLSVAIVMDDGSRSGFPVPSEAEVEELVSAALGLDPARGDTIQVTQLPFPEPEAKGEGAPGGGIVDLLPRIVGALVLLLVAVALLLMMRGRGRRGVEALRELEWIPAEALPEASVGAATAGEVEPAHAAPRDVMDLVQRQPEEIAALLRSWLADRRR